MTTTQRGSSTWVTQEHPLKSGASAIIERNAKHKYRLLKGSLCAEELCQCIEHPEVQGASAIVKYVQSFDSGFGAGQGWATKLIRESKNLVGHPECLLHHGDYDLPRKVGNEARDMGTQLHDEVDDFIRNKKVAEHSPMFVSWHKVVDPLFDWLTSEQFLVHKDLHFGGTFDAVGLDRETGEITIIDHKTVDLASWEKYGSKNRREENGAQLAAYAAGLHSLNSRYAPDKGLIAYVLRDGSGTFLEEVNLSRGYGFFLAARETYNLHKYYEAEDKK